MVSIHVNDEFYIPELDRDHGQERIVSYKDGHMATCGDCKHCMKGEPLEDPFMYVGGFIAPTFRRMYGICTQEQDWPVLVKLDAEITDASHCPCEGDGWEGRDEA